jgi:hypothetical protein
MKTSSCLYLFLAGSLFLGCTGGANSKKREILTGDWSLEAAFRDDEETQTLDGLFMTFEKDGTVRTNIESVTDEYVYEIVADKLILESDKILEFTIQELKDSSLILVTRINKSEFKLWFVK